MLKHVIPDTLILRQFRSG